MKRRMVLLLAVLLVAALAIPTSAGCRRCSKSGPVTVTSVIQVGFLPPIPVSVRYADATGLVEAAVVTGGGGGTGALGGPIGAIVGAGVGLIGDTIMQWSQNKADICVASLFCF